VEGQGVGDAERNEIDELGGEEGDEGRVAEQFGQARGELDERVAGLTGGLVQARAEGEGAGDRDDRRRDRQAGAGPGETGVGGALKAALGPALESWS